MDLLNSILFPLHKSGNQYSVQPFLWLIWNDQHILASMRNFGAFCTTGPFPLQEMGQLVLRLGENRQFCLQTRNVLCNFQSWYVYIYVYIIFQHKSWYNIANKHAQLENANSRSCILANFDTRQINKLPDTWVYCHHAYLDTVPKHIHI